MWSPPRAGPWPSREQWGLGTEQQWILWQRREIHDAFQLRHEVHEIAITLANFLELLVAEAEDPLIKIMTKIQQSRFHVPELKDGA